jgi:hypothetical protein
LKKTKKRFTNIQKSVKVVFWQKPTGGIFVNNYNYIIKAIKDQAQDLMKELTNNITKDLTSSALEYGAIVRCRNIKDAKLLLQVLLIYAISDISQKMLAVCAYLMDSINISDQAWQKKFLRCVPWLEYLLGDIMSNIALKDIRVFQNEPVHLLDASIFKQEGKDGKQIRLHMDYNLSAGTIEGVKLTDIHTAESVQEYTIKPKHIYIADAGYGKGKNLAHVVSCKANALFRMTPSQARLSWDSKGKTKINMLDLLKTKENLIDISCFIHSANGNYIPVRIIASRLPEDKALLSKERKKRIASKKQSKLKTETLVYAEWVILMTSLDQSYSAKRLLEMYRGRWQIELLFKRIKQFFKVTQLRKATLEHSKALILINLIIWVATERQVIAAEVYLMEKDIDMEQYSLEAITEFFFLRFKTIINSLWAFCFDFDVDFMEIYRRLRNHKRGRRNQYVLLRFACSSPLGA